MKDDGGKGRETEKTHTQRQKSKNIPHCEERRKVGGGGRVKMLDKNQLVKYCFKKTGQKKRLPNINK